MSSVVSVVKRSRRVVNGRYRPQTISNASLNRNNRSQTPLNVTKPFSKLTNSRPIAILFQNFTNFRLDINTFNIHNFRQCLRAFCGGVGRVGLRIEKKTSCPLTLHSPPPSPSSATRRIGIFWASKSPNNSSKIAAESIVQENHPIKVDNYNTLIVN